MKIKKINITNMLDMNEKSSYYHSTEKNMEIIENIRDDIHKDLLTNSKKQKKSTAIAYKKLVK